MTMLERVVAFAQSLGYHGLSFSNAVDANVFVELAREKSALQGAELNLAYNANTVTVDVANGESTTLDWEGLLQYTVCHSGIVNRA